MKTIELIRVITVAGVVVAVLWMEYEDIVLDIVPSYHLELNQSASGSMPL